MTVTVPVTVTVTVQVTADLKEDQMTSEQIAREIISKIHFCNEESLELPRIKCDVQLIAQALSAERAKASVLVSALEFYASGHDPNSEWFREQDGDLVPVYTQMKHLDKDGNNYANCDHVCVSPSRRSGKRARQALSKYKKERE